jgi:hypothetical protein
MNIKAGWNKILIPSDTNTGNVLVLVSVEPSKSILGNPD